MNKPLPTFKSCLSFLLFFLLATTVAQATHLRAGQIYASTDTTANPIPGRFFFTLVTFSVAPPPFEDLEATLHFGDCSSQTAAHVSRTLLSNGQNNTFLNTYCFEHTYAKPGTFSVTFVGENRNGGVVNISSSVQQTFFLQATVTVDPTLGVNRSPILQYAPVDVAVRNKVFVHNPAAFDLDGDSLSYKMVAPRISSGVDACGNPVGITAPGYRELGQFTGRTATGRPSGFSLDANTGQMTWNTPGVLGEFNIAFEVEEWRSGRLIGKVTRDMQIFVREDSNHPPLLTVPQGLCVVAGTSVHKVIQAADEDQDPMVLSALGPMFTLLSSNASFITQDGASGVFTWSPGQLDIRAEPYQVVFRAEEQKGTNQLNLVDLQPWRITVLGPAPTLTAAVRETDASIRLTWETYAVPNARRLYIYRKVNPSNLTPSACDKGIPTMAGYSLIGSVTAATTSYVDNNNGRGLDLSQDYSYRLYADFNAPKGGTSMASNEITTGRLTGISDEIKGQISFHPNPTTGILMVQAPTAVKVWAAQVFDPTGKVLTLLIPQKTAEEWILDVRHLPEGFYLLRLQTDQGTLAHKLVIQR
ncbi:T9SS type A sorting domain-containing protein [Rufibacter roseolus]|uniref:T9SS type A sorting domain-containing protein n=1 Tax=Rufibacter roseolus TaxID=2817375 RepID=UPI001B31723C|nr:T9SS type A sorting domain-containing protein [Rufibacter roseolus]